MNSTIPVCSQSHVSDRHRKQPDSTRFNPEFLTWPETFFVVVIIKTENLRIVL